MLGKIKNYLFTPQGRSNLRYALARKVVNPFLRRFGYTLVADHFYQPIPSRKDLLDSNDKPRSLPHILHNLEDQIRFSEAVLDRYKDEFNNAEVISKYGFHQDRSGLGPGDAELYYAMLRYAKPKRVVEVGAGASTLIALAALHQNHVETQSTVHFVSIEPYPRPSVSALVNTQFGFVNFELLRLPVQQVEPEVFHQLGENDILFIDSSHVWKQGSDVEHEFLTIYPALQKDVYVHIHDIFFPFDYPLVWNEKRNRFWNEQYHLETFLLLNQSYKIITSNSLVNHECHSIFTNTINGYRKDYYPSSFWMQRVDNP